MYLILKIHHCIHEYIIFKMYVCLYIQGYASFFVQWASFYVAGIAADTSTNHALMVYTWYKIQRFRLVYNTCQNDAKKPLCGCSYTSAAKMQLVHFREKMLLNWKNPICWQDPASSLWDFADVEQASEVPRHIQAASAGLLL